MLRAASVGLGWWSAMLADAIHGKSDKIRIISCTSRSADKRAAFAARFDTGSHASYEAVLSDPDIEAVILSTPHSLHGAQVRQAAAAGKHVFVEKPFALTLIDAQAAIAACELAGVVLAVGHNRRFSPAVRAFKRLIDAGKLGQILHGEAQFSLPSALNYGADHWRADRAESPAGGMTGLGIHMVDALTHLLGPVARVCAFSKRQAASVDIDDTTCAILECANGRTAYLGTLFATQPTRFLNVYGTAAAGYADDDLTTLRLRTGDAAATPVALDSVDTLRDELDAFADAVAGRAPYPILPAQAAHNVAVMEAIIASSAAGGVPVVVAEVV